MKILFNIIKIREIGEIGEIGEIKVIIERSQNYLLMKVSQKKKITTQFKKIRYYA
jgi:hypothetical protein